VWAQYPYFFALIRKPYDQAQLSHANAVLALTGVTSGFSLQLKVSLAVAFLVSSPVWLYQTWRFIAPGLHRHERRWAVLFTVIAVPLFVSGAALAYHVMPRMLDVLFSFTPADVSNVTSVDAYLGFFIQMHLFFGIGFLLPYVLVLLNAAGILSGERIRSSWRWLILGSFTFGAVATPNGDPFGMTVVAVPMLLLCLLAMAVALANDKRRARRARTTGTNQWSDEERSPL
jgi:sec-independent protein translocase protein TatC